MGPKLGPQLFLVLWPHFWVQNLAFVLGRGRSKLTAAHIRDTVYFNTHIRDTCCFCTGHLSQLRCGPETRHCRDHPCSSGRNFARESSIPADLTPEDGSNQFQIVPKPWTLVAACVWACTRNDAFDPVNLERSQDTPLVHMDFCCIRRDHGRVLRRKKSVLVGCRSFWSSLPCMAADQLQSDARVRRDLSLFTAEQDGARQCRCNGAASCAPPGHSSGARKDVGRQGMSKHPRLPTSSGHCTSLRVLWTADSLARGSRWEAVERLGISHAWRPHGKETLESLPRDPACQSKDWQTQVRWISQRWACTGLHHPRLGVIRWTGPVLAGKTCLRSTLRRGVGFGKGRGSLPVGQEELCVKPLWTRVSEMMQDWWKKQCKCALTLAASELLQEEVLESVQVRPDWLLNICQEKVSQSVCCLKKYASCCHYWV